MKKYVPVFLILAMLLAYNVNTAIPLIMEDHNLDGITSAIKKGSSSELAAYFNNTLELSIPGNDGTYSKTQAEMIMKVFFDKYPPSSFVIKNKGSSKTENNFVIGELKSGKDVFNVYFMLKDIGGKSFIHQLKIEK
jgi:hypothetical protein